VGQGHALAGVAGRMRCDSLIPRLMAALGSGLRKTQMNAKKTRSYPPVGLDHNSGQWTGALRRRASSRLKRRDGASTTQRTESALAGIMIDSRLSGSHPGGEQAAGVISSFYFALFALFALFAEGLDHNPGHIALREVVGPQRTLRIADLP
jgi:hypothetical protein